jgi:hypothetical protein
MNPNNRAPKRPINHYEEVNEVECLHDIPVTHIRRRGRWIPYVSNFILYYYFTYIFILGLFME